MINNSKIENIKNEIYEWRKEWWSSELVFDRELPVDYMCDNFQSVRKGIINAENYVNEAQNSDEIDTIEDYLGNIEYELSGIVNKIDELNEQVEVLRTWGQSWKELFKEIVENENIDLTKYSGIYWALKNK